MQLRPTHMLLMSPHFRECLLHVYTPARFLSAVVEHCVIMPVFLITLSNRASFGAEGRNVHHINIQMPPIPNWGAISLWTYVPKPNQ